MLVITRSKTPDLVFVDRLSKSQAAPQSPVEYPSPKLGHDSPIVPRRLGSASTADSDPFSDILPWEALFDAHIWGARSPTAQSFPSDVSKQDTTSESVLDTSVFPASAIFDPTTIEFGFDPSCLGGMDDVLLRYPLEAFAAVCWADATVRAESEPVLPRPRSPAATMETPRVAIVDDPTFGMAESVWTSDSDESDSENGTFDGDMFTHTNETVTAIHSAPPFRSFGKEKTLWYDDLHVSYIASQPYFSISNPTEPIRPFPVSVSPMQKTTTSLPRRIATLCTTFPTRLSLLRSSTIAR